jgi:hypothetical protein
LIRASIIVEWTTDVPGAGSTDSTAPRGAPALGLAASLKWL